MQAKAPREGIPLVRRKTALWLPGIAMRLHPVDGLCATASSWRRARFCFIEEGQ
jgi:hypothetical protein